MKKIDGIIGDLKQTAGRIKARLDASNAEVDRLAGELNDSQKVQQIRDKRRDAAYGPDTDRLTELRRLLHAQITEAKQAQIEASDGKTALLMQAFNRSDSLTPGKAAFMTACYGMDAEALATIADKVTDPCIALAAYSAMNHRGDGGSFDFTRYIDKGALRDAAATEHRALSELMNTASALDERVDPAQKLTDGRRLAELESVIG